MRSPFLLFFALCCTILEGAPLAPAPDVIVENYQTASREAEHSLRGASMQVEIQADLPKLKKHGRLRALRHISSLGRISYDALRWEGDNTIKNSVIARYLEAEAQAQTDQGPSLAVTPANYKFKYKGIRQAETGAVHVFRVAPHKKRAGLFNGEVWIDGRTFLPVRMSGRLVKNPSIFLKTVEFVRTFEIRNGMAVPRQIQSVVDTRLVGKAELVVDFTEYSQSENSSAGLLDSSGQ